MELVNIEALLEAYFEGNTSLAEESILRDYFKNDEVAAGLKQYQPLFAGLEIARTEVSNRNIEMPQNSESFQKRWWYGIAASVAIIVTVGGFMFSNPSMTQEENEALMALNESKEALLFLSENLNKGTEQLALVSQFTETKNRILK